MVEYLGSLQFFTAMNNECYNEHLVHIFLHTLGVLFWATDPNVELPGKVTVIFWKGHSVSKAWILGLTLSLLICYSEHITLTPWDSISSVREGKFSVCVTGLLGKSFDKSKA